MTSNPLEIGRNDMTVRRLTGLDIAERNWDSVQFRVIFGLSFVAYFVIAIAKRLSPTYWRVKAAHRSVFADACTGAGTTAQLAFMG
jgi:hypothetical protein